MCLEDDQQENIYCRKVYNRSKVQVVISETFSVYVNCIPNTFRVKEMGAWTPTMELFEEGIERDFNSDVSFNEEGHEKNQDLEKETGYVEYEEVEIKEDYVKNTPVPKLPSQNIDRVGRSCDDSSEEGIELGNVNNNRWFDDIEDDGPVL